MTHRPRFPLAALAVSLVTLAAFSGATAAPATATATAPAAASTMALATVSGTTADGRVTESRTVDARVVRIVLDGVIDLYVHQGATPSLVLSGEKRDLEGLVVRQTGDRLRFDTDNGWFHNHWQHKHSLRADLTLPNLVELESHGVGSAEVSGFDGEALVVTLDGAGSMTIASHYRKLHGILSGAGSLTLAPGEVERIDLDLSGAGQIVVSGQSKVLHARLGGVGSLDARQLKADSVELDMSGLGSANVFARQAADLNLSGLGSASIAGKPAQRRVNTSGLGSVHFD